MNYKIFHLTERDLTSYNDQLRTVQQLRLCQETIDLVLVSGDGGFEPVHSYYLAFKAPKFWEQLNVSRMKQASSSLESKIDAYALLSTDANVKFRVPKVIVPHIDRRMLHILINTMYAGSVYLDYQLCWQLLVLANRFRLDFLTATCLDFLQQTVDIDNCVFLHKTGLKFQHQLAEVAYQFILINFVEICKYPHILGQLSLNQLRAVLADDYLNIENEIYVWRALKDWISLSPDERVCHFWSLFRLLRCHLLHSSVLRFEMVYDFYFLNTDLNNVLQRKSVLKELQSSLTIFNPRIPRHLIFVYGGYEFGLPSSTLKTFDVRSGMWFSMNLIGSIARVYHSMVAFDHKLYIIGGSNGLTVFGTVYTFNPATCRFRKRCSLLEPRCYMSAVRYGQYIVVMGGNNGIERLRTCEFYEPNKNRWRRLASMNSARSDASAAVLNDKIYIAGGVEAFGLSSVEFYSFQTRIWTVVSFMNLPRRSFTLFAYDNALYAVGGCTDVHEFTCLRSVERMNENNQWSFVSPLVTARSAYVGCVLEDKLFTFGGYDGFSQCKSIESYHARNNRWEKTSYLMCNELSGASLAMISDLPNAIHFSYYGQCAMPDGHKVVIRADKSRHPKRVAQMLLKKNKQMQKHDPPMFMPTQAANQ